MANDASGWAQGDQRRLCALRAITDMIRKFESGAWGALLSAREAEDLLAVVVAWDQARRAKVRRAS